MLRNIGVPMFKDAWTLIVILAVCFCLNREATAGQMQQHAVAGDTMSEPQQSSRQAPAVVENPIKTDEPMQGGMMRKGMMKGDVEKSANKHNKKLKEELRKEEKTMPPMPSVTPRNK